MNVTMDWESNARPLYVEGRTWNMGEDNELK
jgi:hypothetical protein